MDKSLRICRDCKQIKPLVDFPKNGVSKTTGKQYYRSVCRACMYPNGPRPPRQYLSNADRYDHYNPITVALNLEGLSPRSAATAKGNRARRLKRLGLPPHTEQP